MSQDTVPQDAARNADEDLIVEIAELKQSRDRTESAADPDGADINA